MSGIQFSSPVTNQKASPAVYASSLATRPAPNLPGRIFVDTDNPSTGMYRDTGSAWVQISSGGGGGTPNLQSVCNVGNETDTPITLTYDNSLDETWVNFYNIDSGFTFDIIKKQNEILSIRALKPSGVDEEMELIFDAPGNTIQTRYNNVDVGIKCDFLSQFYWLGDPDNNLGSGTGIIVNDLNTIIKTTSGGNDIGLKLDFANSFYNLGDFNGTNDGTFIDINSTIRRLKLTVGDNFNSTQFIISDLNSNLYTSYQGNDIGLNLDFATNKFYLGSTTEYIGIDTTNNTLIAGANLTAGTAGGASGLHLKININGTNYKIELRNP